MARFTKEQKIIFANTFYITQDGYKALEQAGIEPSLDNLQKLLSDKSLGKYIDKYSEVLEVMTARTKEAHIARIEELFDKATGKSVMNDWEKDEDYRIKKINFGAAIRLSERLEVLKDWTHSGNNIDVDLNLGTSFNTEEHEEQEERDNRVEAHFKKDNVI